MGLRGILRESIGVGSRKRLPHFGLKFLDGPVTGAGITSGADLSSQMFLNLIDDEDLGGGGRVRADLPAERTTADREPDIS